MNHTSSGFCIRDLRARKAVASRGDALAVEVCLESGVTAGAAVSVCQSAEKLVALVNERLADELVGFDARSQAALDALLVELDGTPDQSVLPRELLFVVSAAAARAAAIQMGLPLYRWLGGALAAGVPRLLPFGEDTVDGSIIRFVTPATVGTVSKTAAIFRDLATNPRDVKLVTTLRGDFTDETFCVDLAAALGISFVQSGWKENISLANRLGEIVPPSPSVVLGR